MNLDVFSNVPGCIKNFEYSFKIKSNITDVRQTYAIPFAYKEQVAKEIRDMLDLGIIERAASPFCNPVRVVIKKDKGLRLCLDARKINRYREPDVEGPPLISTILQDNEGRRFFSSTDLTKGYHQIPLSKNLENTQRL